MVTVLQILVAALLLGLMYRVRGGGWLTLENNLICRALWGISLLIGYLLLPYNVIFTYTIALPLLSFASLLIPHAYAQNVGTWATPSSVLPWTKRWPTIYLPKYTQEEWDTLSTKKKVLFDLIQLVGIGLIKGLVLFAPIVCASIFVASPLNALPWVAVVVCLFALLFPASYLAGKYVPWTLTESLPAKSACWGEFFVGVSHAIALVALKALV